MEGDSPVNYKGSGRERCISGISSSLPHHVVRDRGPQVQGARMAARRLEIIVVFSRAGGFILAVAALALLWPLELGIKGDQPTFITLPEAAILIPWDACVLWIQVRWLCLGGEQPGNVKLLVLIAVEWLVACLTIGMACAALAADLFAHYFLASSGCVFALVAGGMACAAGALTAVSALGMLWIHGSRFRPPQAP